MSPCTCPLPGVSDRYHAGSFPHEPSSNLFIPFRRRRPHRRNGLFYPIIAVVGYLGIALYYITPFRSLAAGFYPKRRRSPPPP
jgi:hypothetical protein